MNPSIPVLVVALVQAALNGQGGGGATGVSFAPDGRLAAAIRGDLWMRDSGGQWVQLTSGEAWDREPCWAADDVLVYASDRAGGSDIWQLRVGDAGVLGEPQRVTTAEEWEGEPTVGPDGTIVFVRGTGPLTRLWRRAPDGEEARLTENETAERWPAYAPDGSSVAYVEVREGSNRLVVRQLDRDSSTTPVDDREVERPAWSPDGQRLTFTTRSGRRGVWITTPDGRYVNLVTSRAAQSAWSPDGKVIALVDLAATDPRYNGDPDRVGDREIANEFNPEGSLWSVTAPTPPDQGLAELPVAAPDRGSRNGEAFDRVWNRTARLYYSKPNAAERLARWHTLRDRYRLQALAVRSDAELRDVVHAMLRERPPYGVPASGRAAVSSAHPVATAAGLEILEKGGNVVDAAVAVSFTLGVVEPDASGIGGYGQMLIYRPGMNEPALIEFMTRAPEDAALTNASLLEDGRYPNDGPVLANVPGTVAGMHLAWEKYGSGKVEWAELLAPAVRAAKEGYEVSDGLAATLAVERKHFLKYEGSRALFFADGEPLQAGESLKNPDLAWTLEQIARGGADAFYEGEVGRRMVADLRGQGNTMRLTDLARYYAAERATIGTTYRGYHVYSSTPPSAGGSTLSAQLNLLENFVRPRRYTEDATTLHAMIEAWKLVPSRRGRIADPGLWPVNTEAFTSKDTALVRWACFDAESVLAPHQLRGDSLSCARPGSQASYDAAQLDRECDGNVARTGDHFCHATGTTAFTVADAEGNVVAVTQTLGTWGGNFYVSPGLGFIYNDKLTSYASDPSSYGARLANARHGSSIAPTMVFRGNGSRRRPVLAAGAAGNAWITSAVYSIVTGVIDAELGAQEAIELPRFLISRRRLDGDTRYVIQLEAGVAPEVLRQLETLGHRVQLISLTGELRMGYAAAITIEDGKVVAAADPRRSGSAGAIN